MKEINVRVSKFRKSRSLVIVEESAEIILFTCWLLGTVFDNNIMLAFVNMFIIMCYLCY